MKQGKTTLEDGRDGFPPRVEVGALDGAVWVLLGPVAVLLSVPEPGENYDVRLHTLDTARLDEIVVGDSDISTWMTIRPTDMHVRMWEKAVSRRLEREMAYYPPPSGGDALVEMAALRKQLEDARNEIRTKQDRINRAETELADIRRVLGMTDDRLDEYGRGLVFAKLPVEQVER